MHYKNGRPAKVGDHIVYKNYQGHACSGIVVSMRAGTDTCNLDVVSAANP